MRSTLTQLTPIMNPLSLTLTKRQLCDLELILNGGFYPLNTFMNQADYESVLSTMTLKSGELFPLPITLDVDEVFLNQLQAQQEVALYDEEGLLLAIMNVTESWQIDKAREAQAVFGTTDEDHPGVNYLFHHTQAYYIAGPLTFVSLPHHYDFQHLRLTPIELKQCFAEKGWQHIVAFQTRNPMHRAHQELTRLAMEKTGANLLIHPVVGLTKPGDIEYYRRVKCYEHILTTYPPQTAMLSLLPLAMRMAGPKEALLHALIRKNYGCSHFIIGRDHAGPGKNRAGEDYYPPYAAQALAQQYQSVLGIEILFFQEMLYSATQQKYFPADQFPAQETPAAISGTELRSRLRSYADIPEWFSYPPVITELRKAFPPRTKQGITIFLTGLPSSGKSTIAQALAIKLRELTERNITLLDGDIIRHHLSKGLDFSKAHRVMNITRVGFVAKEITYHGGITICALVAPFQSARDEVRTMVNAVGGFIEIHVATPLSVCETRDRKGLYKKARQGLIANFTGVNDPYEIPEQPELTLNTATMTPEATIITIINYLNKEGYLDEGQCE